MLERVGDEVLQNFPQLELVADDGETLVGQHLQLQGAPAGENVHLRHAVARHLAHVHQLDVERDAGVLALPLLQKRLDELENFARLAHHRARGLVLLDGELGVLEEPPVADDDLQRRAEVMAGDGDELVLEAGQLPQPAVGLGELLVAVDVLELQVLALLLQRGVQARVADGVGERRRHRAGKLLLLAAEGAAAAGQAQEERPHQVILADEGLDQNTLHPERGNERPHLGHERVFQRVGDVGGLARPQRLPQLRVAGQVNGQRLQVRPLEAGHHRRGGGRLAGAVHEDNGAAVHGQHAAHFFNRNF